MGATDRHNRPFDWIAPLYDAFARRIGLRFVFAALELGSGHVLLDLGGGTGRLAAEAERRGGTVVVVDLSRPMARRARRRGLAALQARAHQLPLADRSVDRVAIVDAYHHMACRRAIASEVARVLVPGGVAVIVEPDGARLSGRLIERLERAAGLRSLILRGASLAGVFRAAGLITTVDRGPFHVRVTARKAAAPVG
jgi:ubiquinone/menaquinone biosynthesis C-methylase UbiE